MKFKFKISEEIQESMRGAAGIPTRRPPPEIRAVCDKYYGVLHRSGPRAGQWSPPNRCGACPLRGPCIESNSTPVLSHADLHEATAAFRRKAEEIINRGK